MSLQIQGDRRNELLDEAYCMEKWKAFICNKKRKKKRTFLHRRKRYTAAAAVGRRRTAMLILGACERQEKGQRPA